MTEPLEWNSQGQPVSTLFDDIYFSTENGLAETRYVFLEKNHLPQRFSTLANDQTFVITETGFGTGLNFLATCQLWSQTGNDSSHLHFISVEKYPLSKNSIEKALQPWHELTTWLQALLSNYPPITEGFHCLTISKNITLTLIFSDAEDGLAQLSAHPLLPNTDAIKTRQWQGVDAWFLDGFAPAKNPDMWRDELFFSMAILSKPDATVATFTAAGKVRKGLEQAGFTSQKVTGFGRKRDMLTATFTKPHAYKPTGLGQEKQPWACYRDYTLTPTQTHKEVAIIGGGIAGCHTAYALANKGYKVTIFEKKSLASGASGNTQGIVYAKLSPSHEPHGEFNLYSLLYAQNFYNTFWQAHAEFAGQACGVLQLGLTPKTISNHEKIIARFKNAQALVRRVSAIEASRIANTQVDYPALFFPQAGWLDPLILCQWLIQHPLITLLETTRVNSLERSNTQWEVEYSPCPGTPQKKCFDYVVIANAYDACHFDYTHDLPLNRIRGQVTHLPVTEQSSQLSSVICGKGYIAPAYKDHHCVGASFNLTDHQLEMTTRDHQDNISYVSQQAPQLVDADALSKSTYSTLEGRVGFRCTTPDYLPIVGRVPVQQAIKERYQVLKKDAKTSIPELGDYYPGLFINVGYGSRGLCYTPVCSELLACMINNELPPLPWSLAHRLNPTRFLIRALIRSS